MQLRVAPGGALSSLYLVPLGSSAVWGCGKGGQQRAEVGRCGACCARWGVPNRAGRHCANVSAGD
eukprot:8667122-Pyramimonas_sp.AAC.1